MTLGADQIVAEWGAALFVRQPGEAWSLRDPRPEWLGPYVRRSSSADPGELFDFFPAFEPEAEAAWHGGAQADSHSFREPAEGADPRLRMTALWVEGWHVLIVQRVGMGFSEHERRLQALREAALERPPGRQVNTLTMLAAASAGWPEGRLELTVDRGAEHAFHVDRGRAQSAFSWLFEAAAWGESTVTVTLAIPEVRIAFECPTHRSALLDLAVRAFQEEMVPYGLEVQREPDGLVVELPMPVEGTA